MKPSAPRKISPLNTVFAALIGGVFTVMPGIGKAQDKDPESFDPAIGMTADEVTAIEQFRAYNQCFTERQAVTRQLFADYDRARQEREHFIQQRALERAREEQLAALPGLVRDGKAGGLSDRDIEKTALYYLERERALIAQELANAIPAPDMPQTASQYCVETLDINTNKLSVQIKDIATKYGRQALDAPPRLGP
jgi:hypothetical protein